MTRTKASTEDGNIIPDCSGGSISWLEGAALQASDALGPSHLAPQAPVTVSSTTRSGVDQGVSKHPIVLILMSKRRERTTSAISAGRKKRQKVAWNSKRDQELLQDFSEDKSNSESQENVTNGGVSSHVFPRSHSDAGSQEAEGYESSELSELEHESEDDNERTSGTSGNGNKEGSTSEETGSESDGNTDSASSYHLSESEDDGSSIRTVRPRTRNQSIRPSDVEPEASSLNGDDEDSSELGSMDSEDNPSDTVSNVGKSLPSIILNTGFTGIQKEKRTRITRDSEKPDGLASPSSSDESSDDYYPKAKEGKKKLNRESARDKALASSRDALYINDPDFKQTFTNLRFPYFPERLEVGASIPNDSAGTEQENGRRRKKSTARGGKSVEGRSVQDKKYYDASTITQEQLVKRGLWLFPPHRRWDPKEPPPQKPSYFYEPLEIIDRKKGQKDDTKARLFAPPVDFRNSIKIDDIPLAVKPQKLILRHINLLRYQIEHPDYALGLRSDWEGLKMPERRPEMPEKYARFLVDEEIAGTRESTPFGSHVSGYGPSAENTPVKPSRVEESDSSTENGKPSNHPGVDRLATQISLHGIEESAPEDHFINSSKVANDSERNTTDAEQYIDQERLEPSLHGARILAAYLEPLQLAYDNEYLKFQISGLIKRKGLKGIKYLPRAVIATQNASECIGTPVRIGENDGVVEKASLEWLLNWLKYTGEPLAKITNPSEAQVEQHVGALLQGFFSSAKLHQTANASLKYSRHLRLFDTAPRPDLAARSHGKEWDHWGDQLLLCFFCGDCKVRGRLSKSDPQWAAQLAMSVGATLNVLTLMHLDSRKSPLDYMPHWMWVPGIVYTEKGYTIYIHHPGVFVDQENAWKWKHVSVKLTETFSDIYPVKKGEGRHASASQVLYTLREQSEFVLDQLLAWAKTRGRFGEGVMDQFIARSRDDAGQLDWVLKAAENYVFPLA